MIHILGVSGMILVFVHTFVAYLDRKRCSKRISHLLPWLGRCGI